MESLLSLVTLLIARSLASARLVEIEGEGYQSFPGEVVGVGHRQHYGPGWMIKPSVKFPPRKETSRQPNSGAGAIGDFELPTVY